MGTKSPKCEVSSHVPDCTSAKCHVPDAESSLTTYDVGHKAVEVLTKTEPGSKCGVSIPGNAKIASIDISVTPHCSRAPGHHKSAELAMSFEALLIISATTVRFLNLVHSEEVTGGTKM